MQAADEATRLISQKLDGGDISLCEAGAPVSWQVDTCWRVELFPLHSLHSLHSLYSLHSHLVKRSQQPPTEGRPWPTGEAWPSAKLSCFYNFHFSPGHLVVLYTEYFVKVAYRICLVLVQVGFGYYPLNRDETKCSD